MADLPHRFVDGDMRSHLLLYDEEDNLTGQTYCRYSDQANASHDGSIDGRRREMLCQAREKPMLPLCQTCRAAMKNPPRVYTPPSPSLGPPRLRIVTGRED